MSRLAATSVLFALASGCANQPSTLTAPIVIPNASASEPSSVAPPASDLHRSVGAHASVRVLDVRRDDASGDSRPSLAATLALGRPDLGLDEPERLDGHRLTVDLPRPLRVRLAYLSAAEDRAPESGEACDIPRYPHDCPLPHGAMVPDGGSELRLLAKITFEDGSFEALPLTVPLPSALPAPEVLEPTATPPQGEALLLAFRDVGADGYGVHVSQCEPYQNDGINPCLDSFHIDLVRRGTAMSASSGFDDLKPEATTGDSRIVVRAARTLQFTASLEVEVVAEKRSALRGTRLLSRSTVRRSFER